MELNEQEQHTLNQFLSGKLTDADAQKVKARIDSDPFYKKEVEIQAEMLEALYQAEKERIQMMIADVGENEIKIPLWKQPRVWAATCLIPLMIAIGAYLLIPSNSDLLEIADFQLEFKDKLSPLSGSSGNDSPWIAESYTLIGQKQFAEAIEVLEKVSVNDSLYPLSLKCKWELLVELNQCEQFESELTNYPIENFSSGQDRIHWQRALCAIEAKEYDRAQLELTAVQSTTLNKEGELALKAAALGKKVLWTDLFSK